jgi:transposase InsO family protein
VGQNLAGRGFKWSTVADFLHLNRRTFRQWRSADQRQTPIATLLGRPVVRSPRERRNEVIHLLDELGPGLGLPTLRTHFPDLLRAELHDLRTRYRRVWRRRHQEPWRVLHWQTPGHVWAMDFTEWPARVDGRDRYLLAVRDLASGAQLLWQPVPAPTAIEVRAALATLFVQYGAPLVLKSDNGSAFGAAPVPELLADFGVESLFSPPHVPQYNGAIEAGIGSLKTRTNQQAARHGRPGQWSSDDLAAAQCEANATARPHGANGPTPEERWAARKPQNPEERTLFRAMGDRLRQELDAESDPPQDERQRRARDRQAIRRALEQHGELLYTRRRIPLPIPRPNAASIT